MILSAPSKPTLTGLSVTYSSTESNAQSRLLLTHLHCPGSLTADDRRQQGPTDELYLAVSPQRFYRIDIFLP
jgi:hypothetical protein